MAASSIELEHLPAEKLPDQLLIVPPGHGESHYLPAVKVAPRPADAIQPRLQRPVVVLDVRVVLRLEFERLVNLDPANARPATDRLLPCRLTVAQEHFHMHHIVLLHMHRPIVVGTVEDDVPRLHVFLLEGYRQRVILVGLVAAAQGEPKFYPQVADGPRDQRTAVEEERRVVIRI